MSARSIILALILGAFGPVGQSLAQEPEQESVSPLVLAANDFAFALDHELARPGNVFYSPASIISAMLMAYAGSDGETALEMKKALQLAGHLPDDARFDQEMKTLIASLNRVTPADFAETRSGRKIQTGAPSEIRLVNALWGQSGHPFLDSYLERLTATFASQLHSLDFAADPEAARKRINDQIATETRQRILDLLLPGSITPDTRLILTNAIYFKNAWAEPFYAGATRDEAFHASLEQSFDVKMMRRTGSYEVVAMNGMRMLRLPYDSGRQSMIVVLPENDHGLAGLESKLSTASFMKARAMLKNERVALALPRFKMEQSFEVARALQALGIRRAFNPGEADFNPIDGGAGELVIDRVIHKTFVSVDEDGTEAAAATAVTKRLGSAMRPAEPVPFR